MKRFSYYSFLPVLGISLAVLGTTCTQAQVFSTNGRSGVYVQGNGQGVAGTFDETGFHGIAVGPDGKVRRLDGQAMRSFSTDSTKGAGIVRTPQGVGAFAGTGVGHAPIGPGGFDPFAFVFGNSAPAAGGGIGGFAVTPSGTELAGAKRAFRQGRYEDAVRMSEQMMNRAEEPAGVGRGTMTEAVLEAEQVRALALFAMQKYDQAADSAFAVLESRAEWDWTTLRQMYTSREVYVEQLRRLQAVAGEPQASAGVHFVLAYHYLMLDQADAARAELIKTRQLQPDNPLVDPLLASLPPAVSGP